MKLTVSCQICGKILSVAEKDVISQDDIVEYETISYCDTLQDDGVTQDGQTDIIAVMTTN